MKEIWLEKYRPKNLEQVFGNFDQLSTLRSCVSHGSVPHMILTGPPGVGKTSSVLCIARQLLGDKFSEAVKQLNASDERGITVVRQTIKNFAKKKVNLPPGHTKIIILDEADSLTEGSQQALRMIISSYSDTTRFILSCNDSQKIIEAIQSRCLIVRFTKLKDADVERNLKRVIDEENIQITEKGFRSLLFTADGDMRQAINNIQACHFASEGKPINEQTVLHICDAPSIDDIRAILILAANREINESLKRLHVIFEQGHSAFDIVSAMNKVLMYVQNEIKPNMVQEMLREMARVKARVLEGLNTEVQVGQFLAKCSEIDVDF